jgi:hypothetical protein
MFSGEWPLDDPDAVARVRRALGRLPLFPLPNVVLFPHALLPLHIFEPRYRQMVRDVLGGDRLIVMARRLEPEIEGEAPPAVAPVAGVGDVVLCHELPDGRFNIVLRGRARVRIVRELEADEPYRRVAAKLVLDDPPRNAAELAESEASLRAFVEGLAGAMPEGGALLRHVAAAQPTPGALVDVMASALMIDADERQSLLETTDVMRRLERISSAVAAMTARVGGERPVN